MPSYGIKVRWPFAGEPDFKAAEREAIERHSHYYTETTDWLFRAEANRYSYTVDADREEYGITAPSIELFAFPVLRRTPCGATIRDIWGDIRAGCSDSRFVNLSGQTKQYASNTAEEAVRELAERRRRQLWVLRKKIARAEEDLTCADALLRHKNKED